MSKINLSDDLEKFSYALGLSLAANLIQSGVKTIHPDAFVAAVKDTFTGERPQMDPEEANHILEAFVAAVKDTFAGERPQMDPEEANRILEAFVSGEQSADGTKNLRNNFV